MAPSHHLVYLISVRQHRLQCRIQPRTSEGMVAAQSGLLFFLEKNDGALMREAGTVLDLGPSIMNGLVDRTSGTDPIECHTNAKDGHAWQLWTIFVSHEALAAARSGLAELNARLIESFTDTRIGIVACRLASL